MATMSQPRWFRTGPAGINQSWVCLSRVTPPRWMECFWAFVIILALSIPVRADSAAAQAPPAAPSWGNLGPVGPRSFGRAAPSAEWPADPALLAVRGDELARSIDGGTSWEAVPVPFASASTAFPLRDLALAPRTSGPRIAFAVTSDGLHRSPDFGSSWVKVLPLDGRGGHLTLSPGFARDNTAFFLVQGTLLRSTDGGFSWQALPVAPDCTVTQVAISPGFGTDRTIYVATTPIGAVLNTSLPARNPRTTMPRVHDDDPDAGVGLDLGPGVLRSSDGGETWLPMASGWSGMGCRTRRLCGW
jgi:hypothetical protein